MRVVIPSVHYADYLATTLPAWRAFLPLSARLAVVTTPDDPETAAVVSGIAGVDLCVTEAWYADGRRFNKGGALDVAFGFTPGWRRPPSLRETCLSIDADVYPCGAPLDLGALAPDVLYGVPRYDCPTPELLDAHVHGRVPRADLRVIRQRKRGEEPALGSAEDTGRAAYAALGYFQLFRYRAGLVFGASKTAGKYDIEFRRHFGARRPIVDTYVLHLGPLDRRNWRGRVVPPWPTR